MPSPWTARTGRPRPRPSSTRAPRSSPARPRTSRSSPRPSAGVLQGTEGRGGARSASMRLARSCGGTLPVPQKRTRTDSPSSALMSAGHQGEPRTLAQHGKPTVGTGGAEKTVKTGGAEKTGRASSAAGRLRCAVSRRRSQVLERTHAPPRRASVVVNESRRVARASLQHPRRAPQRRAAAMGKDYCGEGRMGEGRRVGRNGI